MFNFKFDAVEQGDCLEHLRLLGDNLFDTSFADPPFNLNKKYKGFDDKQEADLYLEWCTEWIRELFRVTKPSGSIFIHNIPKWLTRYVCMIAAEGLGELRHWIVWDAATSPMGKSLQPAHYGILYYVKDPTQCKVNELRMLHKRCRNKKCNLLLRDYGGKKDTIHPFGPLVSDVFSDIYRCKHAKYKDLHPCQLPIHLLERLILLSTDPGDIVYDPFMGSGTTAVAAKRLGRSFYGCEQSPRYVEIINEKLAKEDAPSCFNGIWASCYLNRFHTVRDKDIYDESKKDFREEWKSLYEEWPETDDARKKLNLNDLKLKQTHLDLLKKVCSIEGTFKTDGEAQSVKLARMKKEGIVK
jgi:site-specific DNA-methyltransferase (adenine-specific)